MCDTATAKEYGREVLTGTYGQDAQKELSDFLKSIQRLSKSNEQSIKKNILSPY